MMSKTLFAPPNTPAATQSPAYHLRSIFVASFCAFVAAALLGSAPDDDLLEAAEGPAEAAASPAVATAKPTGAPEKAPGAAAAPKPVAADSPRVADAKGSERVARPRAVNPAREIEALARVLARKYRISHKATREYVRTAFREGARVDLDPLLIVAVMAVESSFDAAAESDAGALGLMQVIPRYHADKLDAAGGQSVLDPATNIQVGAKVLKEYIARDGDPVAGLLRYNGSFGDPRAAYARKVLGEKEWMQQAIQRAGSA